MKYDIFISYRREDKEQADAACVALESAGLRCWIAPRNIEPAGVWPDKIIEGVKRSRLVLVILSSHTNNNSKHIKRELNQADEQKLPVIAFRVEEVDPANGLDFYLDTVQWLDAFPRPWEKHLQLTETVKQLLSVAPPPLPPPPLPLIPWRWIVAGFGLLAVVVIIVALSTMPEGDGEIVEVNANNLRTPTASPTQGDASPTPMANVNHSVGTTATPDPAGSPTSSPVPVGSPLSPSAEIGARMTQLSAELNHSDPHVRAAAITSLGPFAKLGPDHHKAVVERLVNFIREKAPIINGQCSKRRARELPVDLQAALDVIGGRNRWYSEGETKPLNLRRTDLSGAVFENGHFEGVNLQGACLDEALLGRAHFECAYLDGASVTNIGVEGAYFCGAVVSNLKAANGQSPMAMIGVAEDVNDRNCAHKCKNIR